MSLELNAVVKIDKTAVSINTWCAKGQCLIKMIKSIQIFYYTRCITKMTMVLRYITTMVLRRSVLRVCGGLSSRHCARATQIFSKKRCRGGELW